MPQRRFLIASSVARLIRKERGVVGQVVEGYFPAHPDRDLFVSLEPDACYLVLTPTCEDARPEQRTPIPQAQAEALLALCAGQVTFACTILRLRGGPEALLQRFVMPEPLDLLSLEFADQHDADSFIAPAWLGPEVTRNPAYDRASLARVGLPIPEELPLSNTALQELLDTLEEASIAAQLGRTIPSPALLLPRPSDETPQVVLPAANPLVGAPINPAHRESLMAGLAEALQTFVPDQPPLAVGRGSVGRPQTQLVTHRYG